MVCGSGRSAGWVERNTCIVRCTLDADAACCVATGRLWASPCVAVVAIVKCVGNVHLGPGGGLWVWCAVDPWYGECRMVFVNGYGWLPW